MDVYLVGGAIRDRLLGLTTQEKDWVVINATPSDLTKLGYKQVGKSFPVFIHPKTGEEYALARKEMKSGKGYYGFKIDSSPNVTLKEDLYRRDLTINAMAEDNTGQIIDPFNGQKDLSNRVLRHVSAAFVEDPLRLLRVSRFKAKLHDLNFEIAPETIRLLEEIVESGELETLVPERIWQETYKALCEPRFDQYFQTLINLKALNQVFPEITHMNSNFSENHIIQAAIKNGVTPKVKFSSLFLVMLEQGSETVKNAVITMQKRVNFPNDFKNLALLVDSIYPIFFNGKASKKNAFNAEKCLSIIEKLDALRKPSNLEEVLEVISLKKNYSDVEETVSLIRKSLVLAQSVKINNLQEDGLEGSVIGEKLRELRLNKIKEELIQ
ncbi:MAG: multifunctional CCA tRNA nucleotidyl transferase/2'3'-cyclic phosphodiesterase/2'nucleotidase/phosphatase [Gammaproteobacteria bacterium]